MGANATSTQAGARSQTGQGTGEGTEKSTDTKPASVTVPRSYALVVGISHYKNLPAEGQLQFPDRDAESVYTVLISAEGGQFPAENVHKLIGPQATLANFRFQLEHWLPETAKDDDRVLIYFAGHGFMSGGKAYIAPYDVDPKNITGSAYSMEALGAVIGGKIHAKWKVLLTDSCHSGAITPEADRAQVNKSLLDLNQSLFSLTASRDREVSYESPKWGGGHGIFTYYVIKGMEGEADTDGDGRVTADELAEYVHTNVRNDTGERQNPTSERGSFDPKMLLAYNPGRAKAALKPSAKFGTLVIETNMDGVEVFVDGVSQGVVNKALPLRLPGVVPGQHTIQGVHLGYEPDGPRQENVYPGQDATVSLKITIVRRKNRAAADHFDKGLSDYNKGSKENYLKAAEEFKQALTLDPAYSQAALDLARTYNSLFDEANADKYFRLAISIDPGLHGSPRELWWHVAGSRRSGGSGAAVECGGSEREGECDGLLPADGGVDPQGGVRPSGPGRADGGATRSESRGVSFLAGRGVAHGEELERR